MKFKTLSLFLLLILIVTIALNFKAIGRMIYPIKYSAYIFKYSNEYKLDPFLIAAVIKTESNYNPKAYSDKHACGLMQITEDTGQWAASEMKLDRYSEDMLFNPEFNIRMGCWYISDLNKEFKGNTDVVLAAYNGGRGNVEKWLKSQEHSKDGQNLHYIPFKETDKYVKRVKTNCNIYKFLYVIK